MQAMVLEGPKEALKLKKQPIPHPGKGQVLVRVHACGICRTDLHIIDGDLSFAKYPLILGHEVVGSIACLGEGVTQWQVGDRVGVPWLGGSCGCCKFCVEGRENLCRQALYTGYQINGGYAEYSVADARYIFPIPKGYLDVQAAPLLCAGLIGYRAYRKAGSAKKIGFYGFGVAAHILTQLAIYEGREVYAFTKPNDFEKQEFAKELGAVWVGGSDQNPSIQLDAAIIFAPVGALVPKALKDVGPGAPVILAGIHMSDIPSFPYEFIWGERMLMSVANLTRKDAEEFLSLAAKVPIQTTVHVYPLEQTGEAIAEFRAGKKRGAFVIKL